MFLTVASLLLATVRELSQWEAGGEIVRVFDRERITGRVANMASESRCVFPYIFFPFPRGRELSLWKGVLYVLREFLTVASLPPCDASRTLTVARGGECVSELLS